MISASLQSALNGSARSSGEFFRCELEADRFRQELKALGYANVRLSRYLDCVKDDGGKVYGFVVRHSGKRG